MVFVSGNHPVAVIGYAPAGKGGGKYDLESSIKLFFLDGNFYPKNISGYFVCQYETPKHVFRIHFEN